MFFFFLVAPWHLRFRYVCWHMIDYDYVGPSWGAKQRQLRFPAWESTTENYALRTVGPCEPGVWVPDPEGRLKPRRGRLRLLVYSTHFPGRILELYFFAFLISCWSLV